MKKPAVFTAEALKHAVAQLRQHKLRTALTLLGMVFGVGAVIAALAVGVVVTHRASNVVNFAHAALGTYLALVYYEFRSTGEIVQPLLVP